MTDYIGVDPGKSGAIVVLREAKVDVLTCKHTERDLWSFVAERRDAVAIIEKVHAMPKQGVTSMFNFGMSYGFLRGILVASAIPFEDVTPAKWQKRYGLIRKKGESDTAKKNRHKAKAQELFPSQKITHATADALLIAHYCRECHKPDAYEMTALEGLI